MHQSTGLYSSLRFKISDHIVCSHNSSNVKTSQRQHVEKSQRCSSIAHQTRKSKYTIRGAQYKTGTRNHSLHLTLPRQPKTQSRIGLAEPHHRATPSRKGQGPLVTRERGSGRSARTSRLSHVTSGPPAPSCTSGRSIIYGITARGGPAHTPKMSLARATMKGSLDGCVLPIVERERERGSIACVRR